MTQSEQAHTLLGIQIGTICNIPQSLAFEIAARLLAAYEIYPKGTMTWSPIDVRVETLEDTVGVAMELEERVPPPQHEKDAFSESKRCDANVTFTSKVVEKDPNVTQTDQQLEIAIAALFELTRPSGRFSRDQLEHAKNTIEEVVLTANNALDEIRELQ
jgi:hypothetical protein